MIIKCKMCGGDLVFQPGDTYGKCDSCDSVCTIPTVQDEQELNRYNRANHFCRQCDFDKAVAAYEKILAQDEKDLEYYESDLYKEWEAMKLGFAKENK